MTETDRLRLQVRAAGEILQAIASALPPALRERAREYAAERRRELAREVTDDDSRAVLLREFDALARPLRRS